MEIPKNNKDFGFTIYWRIENFNPDPSFDCLKSQIFKVHCMDSNWQIEIEHDMNDDCLKVFLHKQSNYVPFLVHYSLSLLTGSGWMNLENRRDKFVVGVGYGEAILDLGNLKRNEWFYLPNGSLTISFHMWNNRVRDELCQRVMISRLRDGDYLRHRPIQTFSSLIPSDLFSFPLSYQFQCTSLSKLDCQKSVDVKNQQTQTDTTYVFRDLNDLCELMKVKEFSFVTLRTPSKDFSVLKAVLCAKSPVFNAMFERKMKESASNVVDIDDIDSETMALLVKFLHFQHIEELEWGAVVSLYYAADKYQIDSLRDKCIDLLKKVFSIENICDLLILADLHQDEDLMNCASEYFCQHSKIILQSQQWRDILGHTELVANLLCKLAKTMH